MIGGYSAEPIRVDRDRIDDCKRPTVGRKSPLRAGGAGFLKGEPFDRHLSRVWWCESVMLIEAVLLIVFANLPVLHGAGSAQIHTGPLAIATPQHRTNEPRKNARLTAKCNAAAATRADPDRSKISIKAAA